MRQLILLTTLCLCLARTAAAQPPSGQRAGHFAAYAAAKLSNGIVAGEEGLLGERCCANAAEIGRQVNLNADMYWRWSGASSWYPGVFEAWPVVPGEIVGWPAGVSPPSVSPTNVARRPTGAWAAAQPLTRPIVQAGTRGHCSRSDAGGWTTSTNQPRLLPGFTPQAEPSGADCFQARQIRQRKGATRWQSFSSRGVASRLVFEPPVECRRAYLARPLHL